MIEVFVDMKNPNKKIRQDSINLVEEILDLVAPVAKGLALSLVYIDNTLYHSRRARVGINHAQIPAIAINNKEQVFPYP